MDNKDVCCGCGHPTTNSVHCEECWNALIQERDGYIEALNKIQESLDKCEEENLRLQGELCKALR